MVIGTLEKSARYEALQAGLDKAFAYIRAWQKNPQPVGRYEIDGDRIYALVQEYDSAEPTAKKWEAHRNYLDVQFVAEGQETMYYTPAGTLAQKGDYIPEKDIVYFEEGPSTALRCPAETFAIFFPEDLHKPGCLLESAGKVRKIVVKVKL